MQKFNEHLNKEIPEQYKTLRDIDQFAHDIFRVGFPAWLNLFEILHEPEKCLFLEKYTSGKRS